MIDTVRSGVDVPRLGWATVVFLPRGWRIATKTRGARGEREGMFGLVKVILIAPDGHEENDIEVRFSNVLGRWELHPGRSWAYMDVDLAVAHAASLRVAASILDVFLRDPDRKPASAPKVSTEIVKYEGERQ